MPIDGKIKANEDFWQNLASESIYGSFDKRAKAAETLKAIIVWAFALFSTGGFSLMVFGNAVKDYNIVALILFGFTFFCLTIAYAKTAEATYPTAQKYNPSDPPGIKDAFSNAVLTQSNKFNFASWVTFIGFFFLAMGILVQFGSMTGKQPVQEKKPAAGFLLHTAVSRLKKDSVFIPITIEGEKNALFHLSLINTTPDKRTADNEPKRLLLNQVFRADTGGRLYYSYQVTDSLIQTILIDAKMQQAPDGDASVTLEKSVKLTISPR